ncbi:hypothetical protein J6590_049704 [Homalodisca vitripennis]|nr:hypothetical protein J6590_049704 [Homalodisca vitripennis]
MLDLGFLHNFNAEDVSSRGLAQPSNNLHGVRNKSTGDRFKGGAPFNGGLRYYEPVAWGHYLGLTNLNPSGHFRRFRLWSVNFRQYPVPPTFDNGLFQSYELHCTRRTILDQCQEEDRTTFTLTLLMEAAEKNANELKTYIFLA